MLARLRESPSLPTLPMVAVKVLELTRRDDVSVHEIAELIMKDPALTSKILRTVNSPFYGITKQVSTVSGALVILGLQAAKTLALGFSLLSDLKGGSRGGGGGGGEQVGFDPGAFWKRSLYSAVGSRVIARILGLVQQEEAFLAGLLANMGALVMHRIMAAEFDPLCTQARGDPRTLHELCRQKLGVDPPEVSAMLAEIWQLPPLLAKPIALQVMGTEKDPQIMLLADAVGAGLVMAEVFVARHPAEAIAQARQALRSRLGFTPEQVESALDQIGKSAREAASLFDLQLGKERSYQEILQEAQQALVDLSMQGQMQVQTIQKQVETLQVKATTDPLTGMANRARFDEFLDEQFRRAFSLNRPLALVIVDIDHFKKVNDTYGHQAGDEVLRRVAKLLRASVRAIDLAARYGGEEFALILTETDSTQAAVRAEALRAKLAAHKIPWGPNTIEVTLSAGVAGMDRLRIFNQAAQLTNAADRAAYAAKMAGRNCIRVFRPKPPAAAPGSVAAAAPASGGGPPIPAPPPVAPV